MTMRVSVIITTYNQPEQLEKVMWGYASQTHSDFELIVADADGLDRAIDWLSAEMMSAAPGAVAAAKELVRFVEGRKIDHDLMHETADRIAARRVSDEGREGIKAFLERRKPDWAV